ncbi:hypothetical protein NA57DRAFT_38732 [Rhizodiscina lignyota]|uniref:Vezatin n=1 Tax=Rhizodiscina lignyota TaxID=1504668 RepID=A0A9P4MB37_9PEZI|nr:hypothetical protein NA57DRAFT_38732 [Rhizodiscina lignyota]
MENIIYEDSPLAEYLEDHSQDDPQDGAAATVQSRAKPEYAPRGPPKPRKAFRSMIPPPLKPKISREGPIAGLCSACARAIKAKPSAAENARFIEHFRYILVASELLEEHTNQAPFKANSTPNESTLAPSPIDFKIITPASAIATGVAALTLIWLVHWSRGSLRAHTFNKSKAAIVLVALTIVATVFYVYARRQLLLYLRHQAVTSVSTLATNLHSFDASSSSAILLIQEVELVSRGYRLVPLPPITRLEQSSSTKRCVRLRKALRNSFAATIPALAEAYSTLRKIIDEDDLERYLDVYDVNNDDVQQATAGWKEDEFEDMESLKALRIHQYRLITLRRLFLCALMALEADGTSGDYPRWRVAGELLIRLAQVVGEAAEKMCNILSEEEPFTLPSPSPTTNAGHSNSSSTVSSTPTRERLRTQFRKLATLSQGIRSLQAKMQILREESALALTATPTQNNPQSPFPFDSMDGATDDDMQLAEVGSSLLAHYDAIGADLKNLVQAWEAGRTGLALSLERAGRRISRASGMSSSGLRSPAVSLGGLTAVDEVLNGLAGTPSDALKALEGDGDSPDRSSDSPDSGVGMEEVFEAVAAPRPPRALTGTPQERVQRLMEERKRTNIVREKRDVGGQMIKELEAVIGSGGGPGGGPNGDASSTVTRRKSGQGVNPVGRRRPYSMYNIGQRVTSL